GGRPGIGIQRRACRGIPRRSRVRSHRGDPPGHHGPRVLERARSNHEGDAMSSVVFEAIKAAQAKLERMVPTPLEPLGYGSELSCVDDIDELASEVDPFSEQALFEALMRRWTTERGSHADGGDPEDLEYGFNLRRLLHRPMTPAEIRDSAGQLQSEATKDDRVISCSVELVQVSLKEHRITAHITPADPSLGPFSRTVAVT